METKDNHIVWNSRTVFTLIICVAIPLIVGALSAFFTKDAMGAFESMNKPPLAPPNVIKLRKSHITQNVVWDFFMEKY